MQPKPVTPQEECIVFTRTYNPNHYFNHDIVQKCISDPKRLEMKKAFRSKRILMATRQPPNLRKLLTSARFELNPAPRDPRLVGLVPCGKCKVCRDQYITAATGFSFVSSEGKTIEWTYTRLFTCDSKNVLYVLICKNCPGNYLGKTDFTKQRIRKHKSDVLHPENSTCIKCVRHLIACSKYVEPFFSFYPFYYADDPGLRHFMERRFITNWKPTLNEQ